jgi:two-component system OmpR family sensor kinase
MRAPFGRGVRLRLLLAVLLVVAAALTVFTAAFNVVLDRTLDRHADDLLRERAAAELTILEPAGGRLVLREAPDDAAVGRPVWIFSRGRELESPPGAEVDATARSLARGGTSFLTIRETDTRLYAVPVVSQGHRLGAVVVGTSIAPYEETKRTALVGSIVLAGLLLLTVAAAARWLLTAALRPVGRMTAEAAAWSERDLDRRFDLGDPYDELTSLAATLDELLDRIAASLRRERRFSAELSHELRTPLAKIAAEAELALRRERQPAEYRAALQLVLRNAQQLTRTVEALVAAAQHEAGAARGTADAYGVAAETVDACAGLAAERAVAVTANHPTSPLRVGVERDLAARILQPIVENACRYAHEHVDISVARHAGRVAYVVEDDGPGVTAEERAAIFEAGVRGSAGRADGAGAGLGLALAGRLARSVSGEVDASADGGGGRFVVTLPSG